eukprot:SAG31_NODE_16627_length_702_cov_0.859038_2_plen_139_part_01
MHQVGPAYVLWEAVGWQLARGIWMRSDMGTRLVWIYKHFLHHASGSTIQLLQKGWKAAAPAWLQRLLQDTKRLQNLIQSVIVVAMLSWAVRYWWHRVNSDENLLREDIRASFRTYAAERAKAKADDAKWEEDHFPEVAQ